MLSLIYLLLILHFFNELENDIKISCYINIRHKLTLHSFQ